MKPPIDSSIKSVKRAVDLLEFLADDREPPSFLELMRRLEIPRSSLFHLLNQLTSRGYIEQIASSSRYRLGHKPGEIAARAARRSWLTEIVGPIIRELSDHTNEFSAFYVVEGDMVRGLTVADGTHALSYRIAPDHLVPLHAFSGGKVALATRSGEVLEDYLRRSERLQFTQNTITDPDDLRREITEVRQSGLGRSRSEYAVGVSGFAMAAHSGGEMVGIINVSVPEPRLDDVQEHLIIRFLREAIGRLEDRLGVR